MFNNTHVLKIHDYRERLHRAAAAETLKRLPLDTAAALRAAGAQFYCFSTSV
jgi:hypothetical protein